MMADDHIIDFIEKKENFIAQDYKIRYWTEIMFFDSQKLVYDDRVSKFEKKLGNESDPLKMKKFLNTSPFKNATREGVKLYHLANLSGFVKTNDVLQITIESASAGPMEKAKNFLDAFESIIMNRDVVPSKTIIILDQSKHHKTLVKRKTLAPITPNGKKLKLSAVGSKKITDFFTKTKSPPVCENDKKRTESLPVLRYRIEETIYEHRKNDDIQILWIPENHSELDAACMASIQFCSEVTRLMGDNEGITDKDAICEMLDIFPTLVWINIFGQIKEYEETYKTRNSCENKSKNSLEANAEPPDEEFDDDEVDED